MSLEESFLTFINKNKEQNIIPSNVKLGIMYSGGVDSSVLLYIANKYKEELNLDITVLYSKFDDFDEYKQTDSLVANTAARYNLPTLIHNFQNKTSLSKTLARKQLKLLSLDSGCDVVLTAHHKDDNVETILINLFRGTSINGLTGMKSIIDYTSDNRSVKLGKPFLDNTKEEFYLYAEENNVSYIEDSTNKNEAYCTRNFIRNRVVPILKESFDVYSVIKTSNNLEEVERDLNKECVAIDIHNDTFNLHDLIRLPVGNRLYVIKEHYRIKHGYIFNKTIMKELERRFSSDMPDSTIHLGHNHTLIFKSGTLTCN